MAKGFTETEKKIIKENLKLKGAELFGKFGIKKTNIEDLTKAVGIGKGTFYMFYSSKEEFFLELLDETEYKIKTQLINIINNSQGSEYNIIRNFIHEYLLAITEENPILKIIINNSSEFENLIRKVPEEKLKLHTENDKRLVYEFIKNFKEKNIDISINEDILSGIFRALIFIHIHKSVIGKEIFENVINTIIDGIATVIVKNKN